MPRCLKGIRGIFLSCAGVNSDLIAYRQRIFLRRRMFDIAYPVFYEFIDFIPVTG